MITNLNDLQTIIAQSFFNGSLELAGMALFAAVIAFVFIALGRKSLTVPLVVMLPVTLIFTTMGVLPETLTILVLIVVVLGLAVTAKERVS